MEKTAAIQADLQDPPADHRLLTRVRLRNYKSIAACNVELQQISFFVGPNGSGKSNFLDALCFVADALRFSVDHALRDRGGINDVRRRSHGHPNHFGIRLDFNLSDSWGHYAFLVGAKPRGGYEIKREQCSVVPGSRDDLLRGNEGASYTVESGVVRRSTIAQPPAAARDRLYLVTLSGLPEFRPVYDTLSAMGFYNLSPDAIRDLQAPDPGELLKRDGSNLASVLARLRARSPWLMERIEAYLGAIVPGVAGVDQRSIGPRETMEFRQEVRGARHPWRFLASNMSDGTLRALGILAAFFQGGGHDPAKRWLIGIEEPEVALHPAAADVLVDSLQDAAEHTQVVVTSHSPDLLDNFGIRDTALFVVVSQQGETSIGPLDAIERSVLEDRLSTVGELLRTNQLTPDPQSSELTPAQLTLFGAGA